MSIVFKRRKDPDNVSGKTIFYILLSPKGLVDQGKIVTFAT